MLPNGSQTVQQCMKKLNIHPMYHEANIIGRAHMRVVQMNHTHSGASKYSCLQPKYKSM